MFSFFKKQSAPSNQHASFVTNVSGLFSNLTSEQKKSIYIFVMYFFPDREYVTQQTEILITRLREQYELVLGATVDDFTSNGKDGKFLQDVSRLPVSDKKMITTMILGFHKIAPLPANAMVEEFDFMERVGITLDMYNEAIRDYQAASSQVK